MSPTRGAVEIQGNSQEFVPSQRHIFKAKYGAITVFTAAFDHPDCGIRVEHGLPLDNVLDTGTNYTVANYIIGSSRYDPTIYAHVPPDTPPGIYVIKRASHWFWERWLRLSLINTGSSPHWVLGYGYHLFLARERKSTV